MDTLSKIITALVGLAVLYEKVQEIRADKEDRDYIHNRLYQERQQHQGLVPTLTGLQESYTSLLGQYLDLKRQLDDLDSKEEVEYSYQAEAERLAGIVKMLQTKVSQLSQENQALLVQLVDLEEEK